MRRRTGAAGLMGEPPMEHGRIDDKQGRALLRLARKTIEDRLGIRRDDPPADPLDDALVCEKRGVFVTLTKEGDLRGCIGYLEGRESVADAVRHNAVNAAFRDPRFSPLRASEVREVSIEVSILTEPMVLEYKNSDDLLDKLKSHVDGVIIRHGISSATFLPQVWEQLPDKEEFLSRLCLKAGLAANEWRKGELEVLTYQVQCFEEES